MRISTLGAVTVEDGSFRQHQPIVLLAYLAHEGPKDRQHLASVFWPEAKKPLNNLSSALTRIRRLLPGAIVVEDGRVGTTFRTDAMAVLAAVDAGKPDEAISGYTGRFLDGYQLKTVGIELEEWIFQTRERIAGAVSLRAVERSRFFAAEGDGERAADLAEIALTVSFDGYPLTEHLSFLHGVLAKASRAAALRVRAEASAMGVELDLTTELAAPIEQPVAGDVAAVTAPDSTTTSSPESSVVGRSAELDKLQRLLESDRLVAVFGFGGVGKTTLVREYLASRLDHDELSAIEVHLASNENVDEVADLIGTALGVDFEPGALSAQLKEIVVKPTLLYLDDLSPTPEICALAESLVAEVDDLSIITTSRPRFPGRESGEIRLTGLRTGADGGRSDAAELFGRKAAAALGHQSFDASEWENIESICSEVGGVPLAIELVAAWLRLVPIGEIRQLLRAGVLLDQRLPGAAMTLDQIIRQSSELLRPELQVALAELSVLRGSFDWLAARSVADIGVSDLAELHDHSMVTMRDHGRMECHPLVAAFAAEQLALRPGREVELRQNHSRYFLRRLADAVDQLTGPEQGAALTSLAVEHDDIVVAWNHAVGEARWEQIERLMKPLDTYLLRSGKLVVALRLYQAASDRLAEAVSGWEDLRANLANNRAWVHMLVGDAAAATRLCHDAIDRFTDIEISTQVALRRTKAALLSNAGHFEEVRAEYIDTIALVDENDDRRLWALLREDLGRAHLLVNEPDKARDSFRATLDAAREFEDPHMESRSYLMLGKIEIDREPAAALVLFDEGERIAAQHGLLHLQSYFYQEQGRAYLVRKDLAGAERMFQRGLELADETGDLLIRAANELGLARTRSEAGDGASAIEYFESSLRLSLRVSGWSLALGAAIEVARRVLVGGCDETTKELAYELLAFAVDHSSTFTFDRARALETLAGEMPEKYLPADLRLDETCERVFQLLRYAAPLADTA